MGNIEKSVDSTFYFPTDSSKIFGWGNASYQQRFGEGSPGIVLVWKWWTCVGKISKGILCTPSAIYLVTWMNGLVSFEFCHKNAKPR